MDYSCGLGPHLGGSMKRGPSIRRSSSSKIGGAVEWHLRAQFTEQAKCLDLKRDVDCVVINELQEFFKKRAVIEQEYSDSLVKLVNALKQRHITETSRLSHWSPYSTTTIWNTLLGSTLRISEAHSTLAGLFTKQMARRLADIEEDSVRLHKQCREMMSVFQQNVLADIAKVQADHREYVAAQLAATEADQQRRRADAKVSSAAEKARTRGKDPSTSQHVLRAQNEYASKDLNYTSASLITTRARNNYLLQLAATNHSVARYFAEEAPDVIDCLSCGFHNSLARSVMMYLSCEEALKTCHGSIVEMLNRNITALDWREDKAHFLKDNEPTFTRPSSFVFLPTKEDNESEIRVDGVLGEQLEATSTVLTNEIEKLRVTSEAMWKILEDSEKKLLELINQKDYDVSSLFITTPVRRHRTVGQPPSTVTSTTSGSGSATSVAPASTQQSGSVANTKSDNSAPAGDGAANRSHSVGNLGALNSSLSESNSSVCLFSQLRSANREARIEQEKFYLDCFTRYTGEMHKCHVLQVKLAEIRHALSSEAASGRNSLSSSIPLGQKYGCRVLPTGSDTTLSPSNTIHVSPLSKSQGFFVCPSLPPAPSKPVTSGMQPSTHDLRKAPLGSSPSLIPHGGRRVLLVPNVGKPKLFGGTIDEYVEATKEPIPRVPLSCIRAIVKFGMRQRGIFRISGSQTEIEECKSVFEHGDDPLLSISASKDVHLAAGLLKLYFRKLSEPPFPSSIFHSLIECVQTSSDDDESAYGVRPIIIRSLSKPVFILLRFLFAFLNHVSEYADENSMDAYNLAICFAPSLMPIPEDSQQVHYQSIVIKLLSTFITHHQCVFDPLVAGPIYVRHEIPVDGFTEFPEIVSFTPTFASIATAVAERAAQKSVSGESTARFTAKLSIAGDFVDADRPPDPKPTQNLSAVEKESDNSADELRSISDSEASEIPYSVAVALADFVGSSARELSFQQGDELYLYRKLNEHWWEGQLCSNTTGTRGLVPHVYLSLKPAQSAHIDEDLIDDTNSYTALDADRSRNDAHSLDCDVGQSTVEVQEPKSVDSSGLLSDSKSDTMHGTTSTKTPSSKNFTASSPISTPEHSKNVNDSRNSSVDAPHISNVMTKSDVSGCSADISSTDGPRSNSYRPPVSKVTKESSSAGTGGTSRQTATAYFAHRQLGTLPENEVPKRVKEDKDATATCAATYSNSDIDHQLAEVMRNLNSLERADAHVSDFQSQERTRELRRKLQLPCAKHTPDLVLDLPFDGALSPVPCNDAHGGGSSQPQSCISSADNFAEQGQDTMRKRPDPVSEHSTLTRAPLTESRLQKCSDSAVIVPSSVDHAQQPPTTTTSESDQKLTSIAARVAAFEATSQPTPLSGGRGAPKPNVLPKPRRN